MCEVRNFSFAESASDFNGTSSFSPATTSAATTDVTFAELDESVIAWYVASQEGKWVAKDTPVFFSCAVSDHVLCTFDWSIDWLYAWCLFIYLFWILFLISEAKLAVTPFRVSGRAWSSPSTAATTTWSDPRQSVPHRTQQSHYWPSRFDEMNNQTGILFPPPGVNWIKFLVKYFCSSKEIFLSGIFCWWMLRSTFKQLHFFLPGKLQWKCFPFTESFSCGWQITKNQQDDFLNRRFCPHKTVSIIVDIAQFIIGISTVRRGERDGVVCVIVLVEGIGGEEFGHDVPRRITGLGMSGRCIGGLTGEMIGVTGKLLGGPAGGAG